MNLAPHPLALFLAQWTLLLALGWGLHAMLRHRHPRWRLILWRSTLCFGLLLPCAHALRIPRFNVPPPRLAATLSSLGETPPPAVETRSSVTPRSLAASVSSTPIRGGAEPAATSAASSAPLAVEKSGAGWSWPSFLLLAWFAGGAWAAIRLLRLHRHLRATIHRASVASSPLQSLAWTIQAELAIKRPVQVRVSDEIASPCLCGVMTPTILIPRRLADELPRAELDALLSHELAHQCRHDLAWCIAWRVMKAVCWFHPLVWKIPDAHVLACEEEADRTAAARRYEGDNYTRLLAQLALRVLRVPTSESALALSASSHLARRLIQLGREHAAAWRWRHSLLGGALAFALLVLTAGWQFAQTPAVEATPAAPIAMASVLVTVQDENGLPVEGATLTPNGLRAAEERLRSTGYGWFPARHGPVQNATTDRTGQAHLIYPKAIVPAENILTGLISFTVDHPAFAKVWKTDYPVVGAAPPVALARGIPLRVAAYAGPGRQRVTDLVPHLLGDPLGVRPEDWQREPDGSLRWNRMTSGKHFLHVAGRLPSGEIGYADDVTFFGEQNDAHDYTLEVKPGVRVEGKVDGKVPRPIKNGWVQLSVHSNEANTRTFPVRSMALLMGNTGFWFTYRPITADGSFVFESVPDGHLKVIAYGDGFISANGPPEEQSVPPGVSRPPPRPATRGIPQPFTAVRPVTTVEVATEPTATLRIRVKSGGQPVAGAKIHLSPNVTQMPTGSRLFAAKTPSSEASLRTLPPLPEPVYSAVTDEAGLATVQHLPAFTQHFMVDHPTLEVPMRQPTSNPSTPERFRPSPSRYVELNLSPGGTSEVEVTLQPKGREFIGQQP